MHSLKIFSPVFVSKEVHYETVLVLAWKIIEHDKKQTGKVKKSKRCCKKHKFF